MLNPNTQLTSEEREAMLAVWAGHSPHNVITTALHFLDIHMPRKFLLPSLQYLKRNRLTGKKLHEFIAGECEMRYLEFQRKLTAAVKREPHLVLIGGDTFK